MKTVSIYPGVGIHSKDPHKIFLIKYLMENLNDEYEIVYYNWSHNQTLPPLNFKQNCVHHLTRRWISEIIFDFQAVIKHGAELSLPQSDVCIGHSAGSILAVTQQAPAILLGSPVALIEGMEDVITSRKEDIFNIVNRYDPVSFPLFYPNVENYSYKSRRFWPVGAHLNYWKNKKIAELIVEQILQMT